MNHIQVLLAWRKRIPVFIIYEGAIYKCLIHRLDICSGKHKGDPCSFNIDLVDVDNPRMHFESNDINELMVCAPKE